MTVSPTTLVSDLVLEQPGRTTVFESLGIDFCCGGRIPLAQACADRGLDLDEVVDALAGAPAPVDPDLDVARMSPAELAAHIVDRHHGYLRAELPGLAPLVEKVARVHGGRHPELREVAALFEQVSGELVRHLHEEEEVVFPACTAGTPEAASTLADEIARMEEDHVLVGTGLARMRTLTHGFDPPEGACTSYRAMLQRLDALERDVHLHVHKENNVLFPRALAAAGA